jgi:hypothetical protein
MVLAHSVEEFLGRPRDTIAIYIFAFLSNPEWIVISAITPAFAKSNHLTPNLFAISLAAALPLSSALVFYYIVGSRNLGIGLPFYAVQVLGAVVVLTLFTRAKRRQIVQRRITGELPTNKKPSKLFKGFAYAAIVIISMIGWETYAFLRIF